MAKPRRTRRTRRRALLLLLLLALLLPLGLFVAGPFRGGGRLDAPGGESRAREESKSLRVRVVNAADRAPVEGATIRIDGLTEETTGGVTGADGIYTASVPPSGAVRIRALSKLGRSSRWIDAGETTTVELAVAPPRLRTGHVRGAREADVLLLDRDGAVLARTRTDASGRYEIEDHDRAVLVAAVSDGGACALARDGDLDLGSGATVSGAIGIRGGPGGMTVHALIPSDGEDDQIALAWTAPLDASGGFAVRVPHGARAWAVVQGMPVTLRNGEIALPATTRAHGRILAPDGRPARGAVLLLAPLGEGDAPTAIPPLRTEADAGGGFELEGIADVAYCVEASAPGCATRRVAPARPAAGPIDVRLDAGFDLHGVVVDADGLPVEHAEVRAFGRPDPDASRPLVRDRTDAKGRFRLAGLGGDSATLQVTAPGFLPKTLDSLRPGEPIRAELHPR